MTKTIPIWAVVLNRAVAQLRSYHDGNRYRLYMHGTHTLNYSAQPELVHNQNVALLLNCFSQFVNNMSAVRQGAQTDCANTSGRQDWDTQLHLPAWISQNERIQIEAKLDQWVRDLIQVYLQVGMQSSRQSCMSVSVPIPYCQTELSRGSNVLTSTSQERSAPAHHLW